MTIEKNREIINSIKNGFGNTLKSIGLIIVFSVIMGEFLKESGSNLILFIIYDLVARATIGDIVFDP